MTDTPVLPHVAQRLRRRWIRFLATLDSDHWLSLISCATSDPKTTEDDWAELKEAAALRNEELRQQTESTP